MPKYNMRRSTSYLNFEGLFVYLLGCLELYMLENPKCSNSRTLEYIILVHTYTWRRCEFDFRIFTDLAS